jgi:Domain of unknown function (DUF4157)
MVYIRNVQMAAATQPAGATRLGLRGMERNHASTPPSSQAQKPVTAVRRTFSPPSRPSQVPLKPLVPASLGPPGLTGIPLAPTEIPPSLGAADRLSPAERQAHSVAAGTDSGALVRPVAGRSLPPAAVATVRWGVSDAGARLPEPIRRSAEHRIGMDFSAVRVHAGQRAAESALALGARAYTVGSHVVLGSGRGELTGSAAARLMMHELTHVAQQSATGHVQLARQDDPDAKLSLGALDSPLVAAAVKPVLGGTSWSILREFLRGMWGGLLSASPGQVARIQKKADDFGVVEALKYASGYALGIVEGLWDSVKGLVEAIWTLIKLPYTVLEFLTVKLPALAEKYGPRIRQAIGEADGLSERLGNLLKGFLDHPRDSLKQLSGFLDAIGNLALDQVRALGHAAGGKLLALLEEPWFDFGRDIGKVVGQILFEVILAVASEGIASAVKSALRLAGELAARAVTGAVELLRSIGRLFGQALERVQGVGRRLAGQAGELFEAIQGLLRRLEAAFAEMVGDAAAADTGAGGIRMPVPETPAPTVLESRALKPPSRAAGGRQVTVAGPTPPKVHPSRLKAEARGREILEEFAERQRGARAEGTLKPEATEQFGRREAARAGRSIPAKFERGQLAHEYAELLIPEGRLPRGLAKEVHVTLPGGAARLDRVDFAHGIYYEIKPTGARALAAGEEQIARYAEYMNRNFPLPDGRRWIGRVVQYGREDAIGMFGL